MRFGLLLLAAFAIQVQSAVADNDDLRDEVRMLVRQLDDDRLVSRDEAEKKLMEIGLPALAHLPEPNERMRAEMRQRIKRIRQTLELQQATAATGGSRITISAKSKPLSAVLAELEQLSGNRIVDYREFRRQEQTDPEITVELKDVMFWEALDQILDLAGMAHYPYAADDEGRPLAAVAFQVADSTTGRRSGRACYKDAFRFEPISVIARQSLREPAASLLEVQIEATWEPRLAPITLSILRDSVKAIDEQGNTLQNIGRGQTELDAYEAAPEFSVRFQLPSRAISNIQKLSGELSGLIPGRIETFRYKNLKDVKNQQQKKAGATVILDHVGKNDAVWQVRIRVRFDSAGEALESHLIDWVLRNEAYLEAADGTKVDNSGFEKTRETDNEFGVAYPFIIDDGIENYTFVYKTPAALMQRKVAFEFTDLPLP